MDQSTWLAGRSWSQHFAIAQKWQDTAMQSMREKVFDDHGLCWSELLHLKYWDPTKFALVDTMHNLFLGEL